MTKINMINYINQYSSIDIMYRHNGRGDLIVTRVGNKVFTTDNQKDVKGYMAKIVDEIEMKLRSYGKNNIGEELLDEIYADRSR